jgi:Fungal trichothecene efflux pump (TRI12)
MIVFFIVPFCPYVLYAQLLATRVTWRWCMWIGLIYNALAFIGIAVSYFPVKYHARVAGARREIIKNIDFIGGLLSIAGFVLL